jgi:subtilisin family serine protease
MGLKVCRSGVTGRSGCPSAATFAAIKYAADNGADVINMSLGGNFQKKDFPGYVATINRALLYANRKGVTMVVSGGNSAIDMDQDGNAYKTYCDTPNTFCVSATGPTARASLTGPWTNVDSLARYSNYGRSAIDVAAPGGNVGHGVMAACSPFSVPFAICQRGTFVLTISGTSMAAPHTSGVAALAVERVGKNPGRVKSLIQQTADDLGEPGTDKFYGKGRINAFNLVSR